MKGNGLIAGTAVLLAAVLLGCTVSAQAGSGLSPLTSGGTSRAPGFSLNRLSGGQQRVSASGRTVTENFDIRGFSRLEVSHAFQVEVIRSGSYNVEVRIDDSLQEYLRVEKRGETLVLGLKPLRSFNLGNAVMEAEVYMPDLTGIEASGASDVRISGFASGKASGTFEADLSGASYLEGEIAAREVRIQACGASRIRLQGEAQNLRLDVSGASNLDLEDFPVEDADIELSGASEAEVVLNGTLDIEASGASRLYFGGSPSMGRVDLSGASSIKRR